jgi:hypothetical protein
LELIVTNAYEIPLQRIVYELTDYEVATVSKDDLPRRMQQVFEALDERADANARDSLIDAFRNQPRWHGVRLDDIMRFTYDLTCRHREFSSHRNEAKASTVVTMFYIEVDPHWYPKQDSIQERTFRQQHQREADEALFQYGAQTRNDVTYDEVPLDIHPQPRHPVSIPSLPTGPPLLKKKTPPTKEKAPMATTQCPHGMTMIQLCPECRPSRAMQKKGKKPEKMPGNPPPLMKTPTHDSMGLIPPIVRLGLLFGEDVQGYMTVNPRSIVDGITVISSTISKFTSDKCNGKCGHTITASQDRVYLIERRSHPDESDQDWVCMVCALDHLIRNAQETDIGAMGHELIKRLYANGAYGDSYIKGTFPGVKL